MDNRFDNLFNKNKLLKINEKEYSDIELLECKRGMFNKCPGVVCVYGVKAESDSPFYSKITLTINYKNECVVINPENNAGYDPKLLLCDFTKDGNDDIYLSIESGGSGGFEYFYIYSFDGETAKLEINNDMFNAISKYDAEYVDGCKVAVTEQEGNSLWLIDLSCRSDEYLASVYDENCIVKMPVTGNVFGANYTQALIDRSGGSCALMVYQRITGLYAADGLGYVQTILDYDSGFYPAAVSVIANKCPLSQ